MDRKWECVPLKFLQGGPSHCLQDLCGKSAILMGRLSLWEGEDISLDSVPFPDYLYPRQAEWPGAERPETQSPSGALLSLSKATSFQLLFPHFPSKAATLHI